MGWLSEISKWERKVGWDVFYTGILLHNSLIRYLSLMERVFYDTDAGVLCVVLTSRMVLLFDWETFISGDRLLLSLFFLHGENFFNFSVNFEPTPKANFNLLMTALFFFFCNQYC